MKRVLLVCEGLAGEPVGQIGGRTPLEVARTPHLDRLAAVGRVGSVDLISSQVRPCPEAAFLALLGYDPGRHFTGTAPLEALAHGLTLDDRQAVFRCDFVTVDGALLADTGAGGISSREAAQLAGALVPAAQRRGLALHPIGGHRCLLVCSDPGLADDLDQVECTHPIDALGKKWDKHPPRGKGADVLKDWIEEASRILETHEINRVRIDLGENPANRVWLWGQGRRPQWPSFAQEWGVDGAAVSENDAVRGVAIAAGFTIYPDVATALQHKDFVAVHWSSSPDGRGIWELKAKIKFLEDFDSLVVGPVCSIMGPDLSPNGVLAVSDTVSPVDRRAPVHGHVPAAAAGAWVTAEAAEAFHEKIASQSRWSFESGRRLLETFLKP